MEKEKSHFRNTVAELENDLKALRKERDDLQYQYHSDVQNLNATHEQQIRTIDSKNSGRITEITTHFRKEMEKLVEQYRDELSVLRSEHQLFHDKQHTEHVEAARNMEIQYEKTIVELKKQYADLQSQYEKSTREQEAARSTEVHNLKTNYQDKVSELMSHYKNEMHQMKTKYEELVHNLAFQGQFNATELDHTHKLTKQVTDFNNLSRIMSLEEEIKRLNMLLSQSDEDQQQLSQIVTEKEDRMRELLAEHQSLTDDHMSLTSEYELMQRKYTHLQEDTQQRIDSLHAALEQEQVNRIRERDEADAMYKEQRQYFENKIGRASCRERV